MKDKTKNVIITFGFVIIIILIFLCNVIKKDEVISITERRKLAQFPKITISKILNKDAMNQWEKYAEDQFVKRDLFRKIKIFCSRQIFAQKDSNKLFEKNNAIYKIEYPLNQNNVHKSAQKLNEVYEKYLKNMNVYYSLIPEKNYFLENDDHLKLDYDKIQQIVEKELPLVKYINIAQCLDLEDYYRTDLHWKQENLQDVVKIIQEHMGCNETISNYNIQDKGEFYGAYYGQLPTNVSPDRLYILTNETIENCSTYNFETHKKSLIYSETNSIDKYDIFVSGATPLIVVENPNTNINKELIIFRDSFASSIAPLLIDNYSKITLIDLRYMSSLLLENYIEFKNQDVLFLYSTTVLNQNILK